RNGSREYRAVVARVSSEVTRSAQSYAFQVRSIEGTTHLNRRPLQDRLPNYPHKLPSRRSVGSAAEPPRAARNCTASRQPHIAPSESLVSRGGCRAAVGQACEAACSL